MHTQLSRSDYSKLSKVQVLTDITSLDILLKTAEKHNIQYKTI